MPESLQLHAASEVDVAALVGLGGRDPRAGEIMLSRLVETAGEDHGYDMVPVDVAGRVVLWHPALPYEGTEDAYWRALEGFVALAALAGLQPEGCQVARDLDDVFAAAGIGQPDGPLALSRRPAVPLPGAEDFDVRVIAHDDARRLLQTWLLAEPGTQDDLTAFAHRFLALDEVAAAAGRAPVDLWLFSPGHDLVCPRLEPADWPPAEPADLGPIGPELAQFLPRGRVT